MTPDCPLALYPMLRRLWGRDTGSKWQPQNPALSQCSVTALLVHDLFGGSILRTDVNGAWHYYNQVGSRRYDLTMGQFDLPIPYDDLPSSREEALEDTSVRQYSVLKERVTAELALSQGDRGLL